MSAPRLVGILNCTPDSFSDGVSDASVDQFIAHGERLISEGATYIDIGGDSTRPGSSCVGASVEWERIARVIEVLSKKVSVSVDTHHAEVAERAVRAGASIINDIGGGADPEMWSVVKRSGATYCLMFSASGTPHLFGDGLSPEAVVETVDAWFSERLMLLAEVGIAKEKVILDTGMGAFVSRNPESSWKIVESYEKFSHFGLPLMLGCSRKGFLKREGELSVTERDPLSAICAVRVWEKLKGQVDLYVRAHDIRTQRTVFDISQRLR